VGRLIAMTQQVQGTYPVCVNPNQKSVTMGLAWQITQDKQGHKVFAKNGATSQGGFEAVVIFVPDLQSGVACSAINFPSTRTPRRFRRATGHDIIAALHSGFALTEPLLEPVSSD
jgi:beta-lactamase class C